MVGSYEDGSELITQLSLLDNFWFEHKIKTQYWGLGGRGEGILRIVGVGTRRTSWHHELRKTRVDRPRRRWIRDSHNVNLIYLA